ncbi:MAG: GMP synthase (glutamine-hydrolyzing) [Thermoplasmatota archaeon]
MVSVELREIGLDELRPEEFIERKVGEIRATVGDGLAVNALSGGVDSAVVTMLAHRALGGRLITYFIDNRIMREEELAGSGAFQFMAILHDDRVTGVRKGRREFGDQIEVRCWNSTDAVAAEPTPLPFSKLERLAARITAEVRGVVSVTYNITRKPPSTMEAV